MKPKLFVGSSSESLDVAYAVQENLERDVETTVWSQGIFDLSRFTLDSLIDDLDNFDFGAFVFAPNDVIRIRGEEHQAPRDNVIFELGLFIGRLGRERCFIIIPGDNEDIHLPTDLLGLTPATFEPDRQDRNLNAALGPACNKILKAIRNFGALPSEDAIGGELEEDYDENDYISILESWMGSRPARLNTQVIRYIDVDRELSLPRGTSEKYLEVAARRWGYHPARKGAQTILFRE